MSDMEYERFHSVTLIEICRFLYETARKYNTGHPITIDGTSTQILAEDMTLRDSDEPVTARIPDICGSTFYPRSWGGNYRSTPQTMSMYYSIPAGAARRAEEPYLVNELQTHTQSALTPGSGVADQELYNWILMCMFAGAQGVQLWRWKPFLHGYQSTGRGLARMDGAPNEGAERVRELIFLIRKNGELFRQFSIQEPVVKFAVSYSSRLYFDSLLKWGKSFWNDDVEGWYRLLWDQGVAPEFTDIKHLDQGDIPMMILLSILNINGEMAGQLTEFVEQGGLLIADARLGGMSEYGEVPRERIPGRELSRLFGLVKTDVDSGYSFYLDGAGIPCNYMEQELEVEEDSQVLGTMEDDSPAVVLHGLGRGVTLYFNSFVGVEMKNWRLREVGETVMSLPKKQCPNVATVQKGEHVHVSRIGAGSRNATLVVNLDTAKQKVQMSGSPEGVSIENLVTSEGTVSGRVTKFTIPGNTAVIYQWPEEQP